MRIRRDNIRHHQVKFTFVCLLIFSLTLGWLASANAAAAQALYTPPVLVNNFTPVVIPAGGISTLTITISNSNSFGVILSAAPPALTTALPAGISFNDPINAIVNPPSCGIAISTVGSTLTLAGGTIPAASGSTTGVCSVSVEVTSASAGSTFIHSIDAGALVATDSTGTIPMTTATGTSATLQINTVQPPSLSKSFTQNTVTVGLNSRLAINIRNNDLNYSLTDVSVADNLPPNVVIAGTPDVTYTNCGAAPSVTDTNGGVLASGDTGITLHDAVVAPNSTCTVRVNVTSAVPDAYTNTIPAYAVQTRQAVTNASAAVAQVNFQEIGLSKSFSPTNFEAGNSTVMTITIRNWTLDQDFSSNVNLTDNLPAGLLSVDPPELSTTCGGTLSYIPAANQITLSGGTVLRNSTCTITARLTAAYAGTYTNVIQVGDLTAGSAANVVPVSSTVSTYPTGQGISSPSKSFSPSTIAVNGVSRLRIQFTAPADMDLTNFSITDALPIGVVVAADPNPTKNANCQGGTFNPVAGSTILVYSGGTIPRNTQCRLEVNVTSSLPGSYVNTIPPYNITNDQNQTPSGSITSTLRVSGLSVSKAYYPTRVNINGISTLTITLQNTNTSPLVNVQFTDTIGAGITIADPANETSTCGTAYSLTASPGTSTIALSNGTIPASVGGVAGLCTVSMSIRGVSTGSYQNTIAVSDVTGVIQGTSLTIGNTAAASATLVVADLTINVQKDYMPNTIQGGEPSTLTITLTNPNNTVLTGIAFTDVFPAGMFVAGPASAVSTCGGVVTAVPNADHFDFAGGIMNANTSCMITLKVSMSVINTLINRIEVGDVTTTNGARNVEGVEATLGNLSLATLHKTFLDNPVFVNQPTTLQITITNVGTIPLTNLGFNDILPAGILPVLPIDASQCNGTLSYDNVNNEIVLSSGSLAGNANCLVQVPVIVALAGSYNNCIPADNLASAENVTNPEATCSTLVVNNPVALIPPAITKSFSPDPVAVGATSALTFSITNANSVPLTGVEFSDMLPAGMTLASPPNVVQCNGTVSYDSGTNTISLTGGTVNSNSSCTVIVATVVSSAGVYSNTSGNISSTNGGTGGTASDTLTAIAPAVIAKQFTPTAFAAPGTSALTFTITNPIGNTATLTGVAFTDVLPTGLEVAVTPSMSINGCGTPAFSPAAGDTTLTFSGATVVVGTPCVISVDVSAANGGTYVNTTGVVTSTNGGPGNSATDALVVTGAGLSLLKSTTTAAYSQVGDTIQYFYLLTNTGTADIPGEFTVADDKAAVVCPSVITVGDNDGFLDAAVGANPAESLVCTATYAVTAADITARAVVNTATATGGGITSNSSSAIVKLAQLTLVKTVSPNYYRVTGNTVTYTYTLVNTGEVNLYPPHLITDDHFVTAQTCSSTAVIPPGGSISCTRTYTITATDALLNTVMNIARAASQDAPAGGTAVQSNNASQTIYKVIPPVISKSFAPDPIMAGGTSTLTFTITNPIQNVISLTGVAFTDNLPAGMTVLEPFLDSQCGGTVYVENSSTRVRLANGFIIPDSSCTVSVNVTVGSGGTFTNTSGSVSSTNGGTGNTATDSLTAIAPPVLAKAFTPSTINAGGTSTISITITNPNPSGTLTGVAFSDVFPAGLSVAATPNTIIGAGCGLPVFAPSAGAISLNFNSGSITAGTPCVIQVDVTALAGTYPNATTAASSVEGGTGAPSNTAVLNVTPVIDLAVTKTDSVSAVDRSEIVTYTIVVTNNGPADVVNAQVIDTLPSSLEGASWTCAPDSGSACTASGSSNINDSVSILVGQSITYTVTATVSSSINTSIVNTASVVPPTGVVDTNPVNNSATDVDHLNRLQLVKLTATTAYDQIGEVITYTYYLTNIGTSTLSAPFTVGDDQIGTPKGTAFTCGTATDLAPATTIECSSTYYVTLADLDAGSLTNHASAAAEDEDDDTVTSNNAELTIDADQQPILGAAKRLVSIQDVSVGTYDLTLEILIANLGNVTLHDLSIVDDLNTTFPVPAAFTVMSIVGDVNLTGNPAFDGNIDSEMLAGGNILEPGESGVVTIVVRVIPTTHYYENTATAAGVSPEDVRVSDDSHNGSDPDPDKDGDVFEHDDPTPIDFGANMFDPPFGVKTFDDSNRPLIRWTMVWINDTNIVNINAVVRDPIPEGSTFEPGTIGDETLIPPGAPFGSTSRGVTCTSSAATITNWCYYEGPTPANPRGQIIWEGSLAPDFGVTDPILAVNAVEISFNVSANSGVIYLKNTSTIDADLNGDNDVADTGEQEVAEAQAVWDVRPQMPDTGFAPGVVTNMSQFAAASYSSSSLWLEIPKLSVSSPVLGVPRDNGDWNVAWLWNKIGWLAGTAFPTWSGNSVLTAHNYLQTGAEGPFARLEQLRWGDTVIIHAHGNEYTYEVRGLYFVPASDLSIFDHKDQPWLTLVTCKQFDEASGTYLQRVVVQAVLVKVAPENLTKVNK